MKPTLHSITQDFFSQFTKSLYHFWAKNNVNSDVNYACLNHLPWLPNKKRMHTYGYHYLSEATVQNQFKDCYITMFVYKRSTHFIKLINSINTNMDVVISVWIAVSDQH